MKYSSEVLQRLINRMMYSGKKSTAQGVVYGALAIIEEKTQKPPITVFDDAMNKLSDGSGNLVRQVELIKTLGAKTNKSQNAALLARALEEQDLLEP